tara:strand:+ start:73 stop:624 length:552 start_codon:yes stop_codon:yes gene_type:complete
MFPNLWNKRKPAIPAGPEACAAAGWETCGSGFGEIVQFYCFCDFFVFPRFFLKTTRCKAQPTRRLSLQHVVWSLQHVVWSLQRVVWPLQRVVWSLQRVVWALQRVVWALQRVVGPLQRVVWALQRVVGSLQRVVWSLQRVVWALQRVVWALQRVAVANGHVAWHSAGLFRHCNTTVQPITPRK